MVYPPESGQSIFDKDPKLKDKLQKEYAKGVFKLADVEEEEPVDSNSDLLLKRAMNEVWETYNPKNTDTIDKKAIEKFIKDALHVYSFQKGLKSEKSLIPKGVNSSDAMKSTILMINKSGSGKITRREFEDFIYTYDITEALGHFLNLSEGINIDAESVEYLDFSNLKPSQVQDIKPVYRNYPDD